MAVGNRSPLPHAGPTVRHCLEEARVRIGGEPSAPAVRPEQSQARRLRAVSGPEAATPHERESRSDAAGARLLATQMAVSGCSREEIELRLRTGFQIEDAGGILDAILGPEE